MFGSSPGQFPDSMRLDEARARFFDLSGLGADGGYGSRWVRLETRPVPIYFPNTSRRVAAAKLHDLHHIATEYAVDWTGESEIAAWEIAGGCGRYCAAWVLNLGGFTVGLFRAPRRLFRAFVRGSRAAGNLYQTGFGEDELRATTVGQLRRRLGMPRTSVTATGSDIVRFTRWAAAAIGWHLLIAATLIACALLALRVIA
jgi:hypothetical protein